MSVAVFARSKEAATARTLIDVLVESAIRAPEAVAVDDGDKVLSYAELLTAVYTVAGGLSRRGLGRGDRVGVRVASGTAGLYVAVLGVLACGAAYVPVDADEHEQRARQMFDAAGVAEVIEGDPRQGSTGPPLSLAERPAPEDDAWVIFTSGSTGVPKGVAVTHRAAAAFVDAEAGLFLPDCPLGPGDRVLAHLSVGFDASCEEMWLAWHTGAALVPAPRALVRRGPEFAEWIAAHGITVVSAVPTLAAQWSPAHLTGVRLVVLGGEDYPVPLADRLLAVGAEVWNAYGPTEATVTTTAARLVPGGPRTIGHPLPGWDVAIIGEEGAPVGPGEIGELVIGGIGLGRYLDPDLDAQRFAPLPALGWPRVYRSGDLVAHDSAGPRFVGRADDQVKVGGRRIELGEVEAALRAVPGVRAAAAGMAGGRLVGWVVPGPGWAGRDAAVAHLRGMLPGGLLPSVECVDHLPVTASGKVDRPVLIAATTSTASSA